MKTCYINKAKGIRRILFMDGSTQFLVRGEAFTSDKSVRKVDDGVESVSIKSTRTRKSKQENE